MNAVTLKYYALICAVNAELEAMKVANLERERKGESYAYAEKAFMDKADQLSNIHVEILHDIGNGYAQ
jgi:hypothetical protein